MPLPENRIFRSKASRFVSSLKDKCHKRWVQSVPMVVSNNNKHHQPWPLIQINSHWEFRTRSAYKSISLNLMTLQIPNALHYTVYTLLSTMYPYAMNQDPLVIRVDNILCKWKLIHKFNVKWMLRALFRKRENRSQKIGSKNKRRNCVCLLL